MGTKLTRKLQKIFAESATNNGVFGSAQAGTKVESNDLDDIQGLGAFATGWLDSIISGRKLPTLEEMQGLQYMMTSQLAYLFENGIPEYLSTDEYFISSIVRKTGTYELYGSIGNNNIGNALPNKVDDANWQYLGNLSDLVNASSVGDTFVEGDYTDYAGSIVSDGNPHDLDLSAKIPVGGKSVKLLFGFKHTTTAGKDFSFRKNGSVNVEARMVQPVAGFMVKMQITVLLDANRVIEYSSNDNATFDDIDCVFLGYTI